MFEVQRSAKSEARKEEMRMQEIEVPLLLQFSGITLHELFIWLMQAAAGSSSSSSCFNANDPCIFSHTPFIINIM